MSDKPEWDPTTESWDAEIEGGYLGVWIGAAVFLAAFGYLVFF